MASNLSYFIKAFKTEGIKLKGTYITYTAIVLAAIVPFIFLIFTLINGDYNESLTAPENYFKSNFNILKKSFEFFSAIIVIISASRISQIEFKNNTWQLLETQPLNKFAIYFAKFLKLLIINAIAIFCFLISVAFIAAVLYFLQPNKTLAFYSIGYDEIQTCIRLWFGLFFLTALIYSFSIRFSNFILSIVLGFLLLVSSGILAGLNLTPKWYPLKLVKNALFYSSDLGYYFTYSEGLSIALGLLFLFVGFRRYAFRTFKASFFKDFKTTAFSTTTFVILFGLICWILKPNQMMQSNATEISGTIQSTDKIKEAYLLDLLTNDTLYTIPINSDSFKLQINDDLNLAKYNLKFDNGISTNLVFGKNDWLHLDLNHEGSEVTAKITGTRLAENNLSDIENISSSSSYYIDKDFYLNEPKKISESILDEYESELKNLANSYTSDNYIIRDDYKEIQEKQIVAYFYNLWNGFEKKAKLQNPNFKNEDFEAFKVLHHKIKFNDEQMLFDRNYRALVINNLIKDDTSDLDENTKIFNAILKLPNDSFKEKLLTINLVSMIKDSKNADEAITTFNTYQTGLTKTENINYINKLLNNVKRLSDNAIAPNFEAFDLDGKTFRLSDYKGKYVIIDVWATWCGPCKYVSPSFEKAANQYANNKDLVFIALSVDQNKTSWLVQAKEKSKTVKQLIAKDIKQFEKDYAIESIPRFIFIDKEGNFIKAKMAYPNDDTFDLILENTFKK